MIGVDTSFLVAFEVKSHPLHETARNIGRQYQAELFGLAPQVVGEFIHIVTDSKRFERPPPNIMGSLLVHLPVSAS